MTALCPSERVWGNYSGGSLKISWKGNSLSVNSGKPFGIAMVEMLLQLLHQKSIRISYAYIIKKKVKCNPYKLLDIEITFPS